MVEPLRCGGAKRIFKVISSFFTVKFKRAKSRKQTAMARGRIDINKKCEALKKSPAKGKTTITPSKGRGYKLNSGTQQTQKSPGGAETSATPSARAG